jgi:DNA primase
MARIPEAEIERLKNEVSVQRLVEAAGIALLKSGKDFIGHCPFHQDEKPSLVVTPAKNLWHCFGCQIGGGPIDWIMKRNGVSFRHAVELLREGISSLAAESGGGSSSISAVKRATVRALPAPVSLNADDTALLNQVVGYYRETLKQSPEALAYLKARGLDHPELIDTFKLGYANRTLGLRLPNKQRKDGADLRARLERIGVYRESGHEHFNGSLVVPVLDVAGNATEIYGRKIRDDLRPGTPAHLYLPGPHVGVWNIATLQASREIILCEALIDAMTFWCAGYRNVTTAYGIEGFTADLLAAFKQYQTERVLIAYDRDEAGDKAAAKLAEQLMSIGIECWRVQFPRGMDANEYALKVQPAAKSLGVVIRKAVWLGKGTAPQPPSLPCITEDAIVNTRHDGHLATVEVPGVIVAEKSLHNNNPRPGLEPKPEPNTMPALPGTPMPDAPANPVEADVKDNETVFTFAERRYRIRGLNRNTSYDVLKVNVLASGGEHFHVDTFDLYASKARSHYIAQASIELRVSEDIIKTDIGRVLLQLEALQDAQIQKAMQPKALDAVVLSEADKRVALELLKSPDLLSRILADFEACGIVGEATNKLTGYLAAVSRKLDRPLAVVIQSSSAAGKSSLMEAVLAFMPEEERVKYSAMTGQSLFYMGETNLKHKILAIVEEEGASRASYALKLLQSEGELTIASTGKDPQTGNLITQEYRVEGPVMLFVTTTAIEVDEELMNRCLVLSVDENREQTAAIHRLQRERRTLQGLIRKQAREQLIHLHRNAQRLIRPLAVVNPYADRLTFPDRTTRLRRDHEKYLTLIDTIALIHQHQREVKTTTHQEQNLEYIEVTLDDIARANAIAHDVLGRSLDELPPQTRRLLGELTRLTLARAKTQAIHTKDVRFARREVRDAIGWGDTQLKIHLARLVEMEFVVCHRAPIGQGQGFVYELAYDGNNTDAPHLSGLIDVKTLSDDRERSGQNEAQSALSELQSGRGRPPVGGQSGAGRVDPSPATPAAARDIDEAPSATRKTRINGDRNQSSSYTQVQPLPLAALPHGAD